MGDRGNIAVIQSEDRKEQVWLYSHWGGTELPENLRDALKDGTDHYSDTPYLTRIIFSKMIGGERVLKETTGLGISTSIGDNEHKILVVDIPNQTVGLIEKGELKDYKIPVDWKPKVKWTFSEFATLTKLPAI